jgi:hypothetical protein
MHTILFLFVNLLYINGIVYEKIVTTGLPNSYS